jgi:hypothetical protein
MAMAVNCPHGGSGCEMAAVMGGQSRLCQANGQNQGARKAEQEAKPTR